MNAEDRLRSRLGAGLDALDPGPGDRPAAERAGTRIRRRRRLVVAGGAVALVAAVALAGTLGLGLGVGADDAPEPAPPAGGSWRELAPMPLAPRWSPLAVWTGAEVLVVGGGVGSPCPPAARCVAAERMGRDGAAYDPGTETWRRIADAPLDVGYWFRAVVVDDTVVLLAGDRFLAYDLAEDAWRMLPDPPRPVEDTGVLSARDGRVYAVARSGRVLVLDVAEESWSLLPPSPHRPPVRGGPALATGDGVLVSGNPVDPDWDGDTPLFTVVERWDGSSWTRYPVTRQVGVFRHWTGARLVEPDLQVAPGLDGDPPQGGRLDPATGEWTPLPDAPDPEAIGDPGWGPVAAAGPLMAGWGYVYDDRAGTWTTLGRPRGTAVDSDQSAVWADGTLVVVGGLDSETAYADPAGISNGAWAWTP